MSKILDDSVTHEKDDTWTFQCPGIEGSLCGKDGVPFRSTLWPSKKVAQARGAQHFAEHKLGAEIVAMLAMLPGDASDEDRARAQGEVIEASKHSLTPSLEEFLAEHGLAPHPDRSGRTIRIEDLP